MSRDPDRRPIGRFLAILLFLPALAAAGEEERPAGPPEKAEKAEKKSGGGEAAGKYSGDCARSGCHDDFKKRAFVHGPVAAGKCGACHSPVAGKEHEFEDPRPEEERCTACHDLPEKAKVVHKPYGSLACASCHDPHGGATRELLAAETLPKLCESCHEPKPAGTVTHKPFAAGDCLRCHEAHQGENRKLLTAAEPEFCLGCHGKIADLLKKEPYVHGPAKNGCLDCHVAHDGPTPFLLKKPGGELCVTCHEEVSKEIADAAVVHGPLRSKSGCLSCHLPHASASEAHIRAPDSKTLCLNCHSKEVAAAAGRKIRNVGKEIAGAKFLHGPIAKGGCSGCHTAHTSTMGGLLAEKFPAGLYAPLKEEEYALCFTCHKAGLALEERTAEATGFRDGDRNLHFVHVGGPKGRSCRICHEIHGGESSVRKEIPFGKSGWMLPIGFEKTEGGGKCTSGCHKPKSYERTRAAAPTTKE